MIGQLKRHKLSENTGGKSTGHDVIIRLYPNPVQEEDVAGKTTGYEEWAVTFKAVDLTLEVYY